MGFDRRARAVVGRQRRPRVAAPTPIPPETATPTAAPRSSRRSSAPATPSASTRSRCATGCGCTPRLRPQGSSRRYAILLCALPTGRSLRRRHLSRNAGAVGALPQTGTSSSTRTCAAASFPRASSSRCAAPPARGGSRRRREYRRLRHHRVAAKKSRITTARSACGASSTPGFYAAAGMIDAHPALQAVSPQRRSPTVRGRRLPPQRGVPPRRQFRLHVLLRRARRSRPPGEGRVRLRHADGYQFFSTWGRSRTPTESTSRRPAFWNDLVMHPNYDDFWKDRDCRTPARRAGGADRRRMVRRRGPARERSSLPESTNRSPPRSATTW